MNDITTNSEFTKLFSKNKNIFPLAQERRIIYYWGHPEARELPVSDIRNKTGYAFKPQGKIVKGHLVRIAALAGIGIKTVEKAFKDMNKEGIFQPKVERTISRTVTKIDSPQGKARQILYYWAHPAAVNKSAAEIEKITGFNFTPNGKFSYGDLRVLSHLTQIPAHTFNKVKIKMKKEGIFEKPTK